MRVTALVSLALALMASSMPLSVRSNDVSVSQDGLSGAVVGTGNQSGATVHAAGSAPQGSTGNINVSGGQDGIAVGGAGSTSGVSGSEKQPARRSSPAGVDPTKLTGVATDTAGKVDSTTGGVIQPARRSSPAGVDPTKLTGTVTDTAGKVDSAAGVDSIAHGTSVRSRTTTGASSTGELTGTITNASNTVGKIAQGSTASA